MTGDFDEATIEESVVSAARGPQSVGAAELAATGPDDTEPGTPEPGTPEPETGMSVEREPSPETRRALEAILMVADQPSDPAMLSQLLEVSAAAIDDICDQLAEEYELAERGFQLIRVAGGWRYQSHPDMVAYVERFVLDGQVARLSGASLETLAIVAYKQPISRAQIAQIRGVNVDGVMRTLLARGFVAEIGTDPGPGQATLFGTTTAFLTGLGINSVAELAPLADFVPGSEIMEALEAGLRVDRTLEPDLAPQPDVAPPNVTVTAE